LGNLLFCTCFEDRTMTYDLKVGLNFGEKSHTIMNSASAADLRSRENWKRDVLLFSKADIPHELKISKFGFLTLCASFCLHDDPVELVQT
jgi:hypothetical protein